MADHLNVPTMSDTLTLKEDIELGILIEGRQDICFRLRTYLVEKEDFECSDLKTSIEGNPKLPSVTEFEIIDSKGTEIAPLIEDWLAKNFQIEKEAVISEYGAETDFHLKDRPVYRDNKN